MSTAAIARRIGVSRSTLRGWLERVAGVAQSVEAIPLKGIKWGFESLHQHQFSAYAYLLGMYLGDGFNGRNYPAYSFSNRSEDILQLFVWACALLGVGCTRGNAWTISIAQRADVARLDSLLAPSDPGAGDPGLGNLQTPRTMPSSVRNTSTPGA
jgi:hypothetical protein